LKLGADARASNSSGPRAHPHSRTRRPPRSSIGRGKVGSGGTEGRGGRRLTVLCLTRNVKERLQGDPGRVCEGTATGAKADNCKGLGNLLLPRQPSAVGCTWLRALLRVRSACGCVSRIRPAPASFSRRDERADKHPAGGNAALEPGRLLPEGRQRNWYTDEPSCGSEACVVMYHQPTANPGLGGPYLYQWNDDRCNMKHNFICKYEPESEPTVVTAGKPLDASKPEDPYHIVVKEAGIIPNLIYVVIPTIPLLLLILVAFGTCCFQMLHKSKGRTKTNPNQSTLWISKSTKKESGMEI
uniref:Chondrolectin n=1 Tax=Monodelphis domestica TaxID=13616 RepID=A0A5F8GE58_MONDO